VDAKVAPKALDRIILQVTVAAVKLQRPIHDGRAGVRCKTLRHRCEPRLVGRVGSHLRRGDVEQVARGLQLRLHVGQRELRRLEVGDRLAELLAILGVGDRLVEAALRASE
jgi:hypothetical protein